MRNSPLKSLDREAIHLALWHLTSQFEYYSLVSSVTEKRVVDVIASGSTSEPFGVQVYLGDTLICDETYRGESDSSTIYGLGYRLTDPISGSLQQIHADGSIPSQSQYPYARVELAGLRTSVPLEAPQTFPAIEYGNGGGFPGNAGSGCSNIRLDGFEVGPGMCGVVNWMLGNGMAIQCPNNNCGPRLISNGIVTMYTSPFVFQGDKGGYWGYLKRTISDIAGEGPTTYRDSMFFPNLEPDDFDLVKQIIVETNVSKVNITKKPRVKGNQCDGIRDLLKAEAESSTSAAASKYSATFGTEPRMGLNNRIFGDLPDGNGGRIDQDWWMDLSIVEFDRNPIGIHSRYIGGKLLWGAVSRFQGNKQTYAMPYSDPGEGAAVQNVIKRKKFSDVFTDYWLKKYCP